MTEGQYSVPNNTNSIEIYVPDYNGNDINGNGYSSTNLWGPPFQLTLIKSLGSLEYYQWNSSVMSWPSPAFRIL